ncbi:MAG: hypothetical protein LM568_02295, partial [Desulfurococcaceae archaeon]|nr:hypothetical protein [Desulfurococcaceae archaeon]
KQSDIVIAINHGERKKITITSTKQLKNITKIGGNAIVTSWTSTAIDIDMPKKSAIVLHVQYQL